MEPKPIKGFALVGEDGNSFAIMGRFSKFARRAGVPKETIEKVMAEARSGDYNHLLSTFVPWSMDGEEEEEEEG